MKKHSLPPQIAGFKDGSVTWKRLEEIDYALLGYFLSSHLIIEHYLDEVLKINHADLDWESSRLTFSQKIALFSRFNMPEKYNSISAIKHLNTIRNKLSHRIDYKIQTNDLLPLKQFLENIYKGKEDVPEDPHEILEAFNKMVCVYFAGYISGKVDVKKTTRA